MLRHEERGSGKGQLVLSRRWGQRLRLTTADGTVIWVSLMADQPGGRQARIGIEAPLSVVVEREEIIPRPGTSPGGAKA